MMQLMNKGYIKVQINIKNIEEILNILWQNEIEIINLEKVSFTELKLEIHYKDYEKLDKIIKDKRGKIMIIKKGGLFYKVEKLKKNKKIAILSCLFIGIIYFLSNYIWAIEINTTDNITPYEIRENLKDIGVVQGILKKNVDVYEMEKILEKKNESILWIRVRIEGSTLKVRVEEKINPPIIENDFIGEIKAKTDGEVKRIYVNSGRATVSLGDFVKRGDVLISGVQGLEGQEYVVPAKGVVIANTFIEKEIIINASGEEMERSGRKQEDIYINVAGKKIYLKKAINKFEYCDRIEDIGSIFSKVEYIEKVNKKTNKTRQEIIDEGVKQLTESLKKNINNEANIVKKDVFDENIQDGKIKIKVIYVVEQNIA